MRLLLRNRRERQIITEYVQQSIAENEQDRRDRRTPENSQEKPEELRSKTEECLRIARRSQKN